MDSVLALPLCSPDFRGGGGDGGGLALCKEHWASGQGRDRDGSQGLWRPGLCRGKCSSLGGNMIDKQGNEE